MRARLVVTLLLLIVAAVGVALGLRAQPEPAPGRIHLLMTSDPFPLVVGPTTLVVAVQQADGTLIRDAQVQITANMMMQDMMLPMNARPKINDKGLYEASLTWPMLGEWTIDVAAAVPGQPALLQDRFNVYIYAVPERTAGGRQLYRSVSEVNSVVTANAEREHWIVIPQGTQMLIRTGQGDDVIPSEIHLKLAGQNVLVIRNDDIADHNVGPFFVRAGETVRQEFTQAAEFVGTCSIRHGGEVSILVD